MSGDESEESGDESEEFENEDTVSASDALRLKSEIGSSSSESEDEEDEDDAPVLTVTTTTDQDGWGALDALVLTKPSGSVNQAAATGTPPGEPRAPGLAQPQHKANALQQGPSAGTGRSAAAQAPARPAPLSFLKAAPQRAPQSKPAPVKPAAMPMPAGHLLCSRASTIHSPRPTVAPSPSQAPPPAHVPGATYNPTDSEVQHASRQINSKYSELLMSGRLASKKKAERAQMPSSDARTARGSGDTLRDTKDSAARQESAWEREVRHLSPSLIDAYLQPIAPVLRSERLGRLQTET
ncbi:hypothetical protein FOA52_004338 [Chlamydomonas sp. UWO 241]|nr:hypothetical protein FOA52_004338 [Chlamydomonas sp. UWO 241]